MFFSQSLAASLAASTLRLESSLVEEGLDRLAVEHRYVGRNLGRRVRGPGQARPGRLLGHLRPPARRLPER